MPIALTTPYKGYAEVKIVEIRLGIKRRHLFLLFEHGDTVDGAWVAGTIVPEEKLVRNLEQILDGAGGEVRPADPAYDSLIASSKADADDVAVPDDGGFNCYVGAARKLDQYEIGSGGYAGTVK